MALEAIKQINIDFHDSKYISVNAKQFDRLSRFVLATCYHSGNVFPLNKDEHRAFVRYRKVDDLGVFNSCVITDEGKILIELTEQMLAVAGKCYADLVVLENNPVTDDNPIIENTGELIVTENDNILSTMTFCINVVENAFDNTEIESSYEYNALNDLMIKATEDYTYVMTACKISEQNAKSSVVTTATSEKNAATSEVNAAASATNAKASETSASTSAANAKTSATNAAASATNAKTSETNASTSAANAKTSETTAASEAAKAEAWAKAAASEATESSDYATVSQSYAVGGTGTRTNEEADNAKYYYLQAKAVNDSLGGTFLPQGTITFSELSTVTKETGYAYCIADAFVTDDTFKEGAGVSHSAGTTVYYTADGYWACFNGRIITNAEFEQLNQTIAELMSRVEALESQSVLEIVE